MSYRSSIAGIEMLIFFAIILHKVPVSVGFGTFLQHEGKRGWVLGKHLLVKLDLFF